MRPGHTMVVRGQDLSADLAVARDQCPCQCRIQCRSLVCRHPCRNRFQGQRVPQRQEAKAALVPSRSSPSRIVIDPRLYSPLSCVIVS